MTVFIGRTESVAVDGVDGGMVVTDHDEGVLIWLDVNTAVMVVCAHAHDLTAVAGFDAMICIAALRRADRFRVRRRRGTLVLIGCAAQDSRRARA